MRDWLNEGVDPSDVDDAESNDYDPGMTDGELDEAHADMQEFLRDSASVEGIIGGAAFGLIAEFIEDAEQLRKERDFLAVQVSDLAAKLETSQQELHGWRSRMIIPELVGRLLDEAHAEDMSYVCMAGPSRRRFMRRLGEELRANLTIA